MSAARRADPGDARSSLVVKLPAHTCSCVNSEGSQSFDSLPVLSCFLKCAVRREGGNVIPRALTTLRCSPGYLLLWPPAAMGACVTIPRVFEHALHLQQPRTRRFFSIRVCIINLSPIQIRLMFHDEDNSASDQLGYVALSSMLLGRGNKNVQNCLLKTTTKKTKVPAVKQFPCGHC